MLSTFDRVKLQELLRDFYTITRIRITVLDDGFQELAAYPRERPAFCRLLRENVAARAACARCDREACAQAARRREAYTYVCHAGLTESIMPLWEGGAAVGYLLFGHVFCYTSPEEGWREVERRCRGYRVDLRALRTACLERPLISAAYIGAAAHILQAVAAFLRMERIAVLRQTPLPAQIDAYVSAHYMEKLDAAALCRRFGLGKNRLYAIFRQNYGRGVAEHIRALRLEAACRLLREEQELSVAQVAERCGFSDYNYFITAFKQSTGLPPLQYRKK